MENIIIGNCDVLRELRIFLAGATRSVSCNDLDLARTALSLLKTLPASRDAVLEYFCIVFDLAVKKYTSQVERDSLVRSSVPQQEDAVINEIHGVLCSFVSSSPQAWAPIISSWSLKLLGQLSSRYNRFSPNAGLNETLHWWMTCKAARTLVDITTQCLNCLINTETEACVNALLDTSVSHSPYFDWVVAHVGSCFSKTVITRVLSLGLKDFSSGGSGTANKSARLKSVVGILGHLGASHCADIRAALSQLFEWSLDEVMTDLPQKQAVVPYLLQLASKSQTLLLALFTDVLQNLTPDVFYSLAEIAPYWTSYFRGEVEHLEDLAVQLALGCEHGGAKIVSLLLDGCTCKRSEIALSCQVLLELLLQELGCQILSNKIRNVPILTSLKNEYGQIKQLLLSEDTLRQQYIVRFFGLMENVNENVTIEAVAYLLRHGRGPTHLSTLMNLVGMRNSVGVGKRDLLHRALEQALRNPVENLWINLSALLGYEAKCQNDPLSNILASNAVFQNLEAISDVVTLPKELRCQHAVMMVLDLLPSTNLSSLPLRLCLRFVRAVVKYFILCIAEKDFSLKTIYCRRSNDLFRKLCCTSPVARTLALRELLESALFLSTSFLFGSRRRPLQRLADQDYSLSEQNYKLGARGMLTGRLSNAFRNSIVGNFTGCESKMLDEKTVLANIGHLLEAIKSCCTVKSPMATGGHTLSLDAMIQVALLLVELISPDVMYNGLPWPEEEFCRVTIERDIQIRKKFDHFPVTWHLLEMLARQQPSLCYCSVLLRALMASLLSQWSSSSCPDRSTVLDTTVRLLRLMCVAQLLPLPLTSLPDVISKITPQEVVTLLKSCVWNYMRDNVPSPALFSQDPRTGHMWRDVSAAKPSHVYTEPLRLVMLSNICHFGDVYPEWEFKYTMKRISVSRAYSQSHVGCPRAFYDAVIIGGGHNGLTAAAYLQKSGHKVCVLEKRHIVGGAAVTEEIVPGFKFSRASYVLSLLRPTIYRDLKLKEFGLHILSRDPSSYTPLRQDYWQGEVRSLTLGSDSLLNQKEISKFSKKDSISYPKYEAQMSRIADAVDPLLDIAPHSILHLLSGSIAKGALSLAVNPELRRIARRLLTLGVDSLPLFELLTSSPLSVLRGWFEDEVLITTLAMDAVIGTMDSTDKPGSGYVLLLHSVLGECEGERGRWGYPVGGMGAVSNALEASAKALGAHIFTDQTVSQILIDGKGVACGVKTCDGKEVAARVVLANTTPKVTFCDLLPAGTLDPAYENAIKKIDYSSGVTKINVAVNKLPNFLADPNRFEEVAMPHHQATIHLNSERISCLGNALADATAGRPSSRPLIEMVIPSVLDPSIAPSNGHVCLLFTQYTPYSPASGPWCGQSKEAYARTVFNIIDEYCPGFSTSVVGHEVLTPPDIENIFGLTGGNIFHGAMSPSRQFLLRPISPVDTNVASPYTSVPKLLLCGSGGHPGGGVSGSPGRLAALEAIQLLRI